MTAELSVNRIDAALGTISILLPRQIWYTAFTNRQLIIIYA